MQKRAILSAPTVRVEDDAQNQIQRVLVMGDGPSPVGLGSANRIIVAWKMARAENYHPAPSQCRRYCLSLSNPAN